MRNNDAEPGLQHMIGTYLRARNMAQMTNLLQEVTISTMYQEMNRFRNIALVQDRLG